MDKSEHDIEILYRLFLVRGFKPTTQEMARTIGITKKTFFNRFRNRENVETRIQDYWRKQFKERFDIKSLECNNSIERFLLFVYELKSSAYEEMYFFKREQQNQFFFSCSNSNGFIEILQGIIREGEKDGYLLLQDDIRVYAAYFFYNIADLYLRKTAKTQIIYYTLLPLLTEEGMHILKHINVNDFLKMKLIGY